MIVLGLIELL